MNIRDFRLSSWEFEWLHQNKSSSASSEQRQQKLHSGLVENNFSLGFKAEERQLLNAVGPDGVRGVLLHPAHPLSDLHQLGKGAEGCQVDQGLTLGGNHPRIGSSMFQQKLHAVFIELEGSALKSEHKY